MLFNSIITRLSWYVLYYLIIKKNLLIIECLNHSSFNSFSCSYVNVFYFYIFKQDINFILT